MSVEAVLWDFGGIFTPSPFGAAHAYAESEGIDPVEFVELVGFIHGIGRFHATAFGRNLRHGPADPDRD